MTTNEVPEPLTFRQAVEESARLLRFAREPELRPKMARDIAEQAAVWANLAMALSMYDEGDEDYVDV